MTDKPNIDHEGRVLTNLTPVEVDTLAAPIWGETNDRLDRIYGLREAIIDLKKNGLEKRWNETEAEVEARVAEEIGKARAAIAAEEDEVARLRKLAAPYEAEYERRGGWHRYFLVTNANGHVHRETNCSTCYPTTRYAWLIGLSGCDEEKMVEEYGEMACTVCFPDAPTLPGWAAAVEKAKAAKLATECEKSGTWATKVPDGYFRYYVAPSIRCEGCGAFTTLTKTGKYRAHKTPGQEKAEAERKATFGHPDGKKLKDFTGKRVQKTPVGAFNALREALAIEENLAAMEAAGETGGWYWKNYSAARERNEKGRLAEALAIYNRTTAEAEIERARAKNEEEARREEERRNRPRKQR